MINENVAIVMGHDTPDVSTAAGAPKDLQKPRLWTDIWMKKNGEWKEIARQATNISQ